MTTTVTLKVTREGRYWVGVPDGYPGSCMGRSIMELMQEAAVILPFMTSGADGAPAPAVEIDYMFTDVPLATSGARTVKGLRSVVGLTDDDSAAMLGISRQRVNQLRNA